MMHIITAILIGIVIFTGMIIIIIIVTQYMHINSCEYVHRCCKQRNAQQTEKVYLYNQTMSTRIAVQRRAAKQNRQDGVYYYIDTATSLRLVVASRKLKASLTRAACSSSSPTEVHTRRIHVRTSVRVWKQLRFKQNSGEDATRQTQSSATVRLSTN